MSNEETDEAARRHLAPRTAHHPIPTIKGYREEKEARRAEAQSHGGASDGQSAGQGRQEAEHEHVSKPAGSGTEPEERKENDEASAPAHDTSEADASATDPRARRKNLKKNSDETAEREVTDPVTHLPVTIQDLTSTALEEVPENDEPFGSTTRSATGLSNKKKSDEQIEKERGELQRGQQSMQSLFPPPNYEAVKNQLMSITTIAVAVGLAGTFVLLVLAYCVTVLIASRFHGTFGLTIAWTLLGALGIGSIGVVTVGIKQWTQNRFDNVWDDAVWDAHADARAREAKARETETVKWLNSLLGSVWPLINPDLFTSLADTLEDVMQASLPKMVEMVSVNDIGQGSESIRILGIKWLPTGAAARSVSEDGKLKDPEEEQSNDRKVSGEGEVEDSQNGNGGDEKTQQGDDGAQQQVAEGLEAEEGDFVNIEVAFAYRARSSKKSLKDRANDMHLYIAFYLIGAIKVPVWVDLRGMVGYMRMRLQLCPDPPFFSLATITFLGQPKVSLSCTPLSKHALNIMDVPLISNFVQSAVDAAMAEYVAPKSLNLDLKDMLAGDDFKKDTSARGVLVVHIKRGYDFKTGDSGIPLVKDGSSDPYVSVGWAKFGKPVWSSRLLLSEMEPWWDETAYIPVTPEELNVDERLRVQLWDSDRMSADDDLGRIEVELKDVMSRSESKGQMWHRSDGFRALKAGEDMPGKLDWSVGYYSKLQIQDCQLQKQTFDTNIRNMDQLKAKVDETCERKLREANIKDGKKRDESELEQQKAQEMKGMQDAMVISAPPPEGYPSGVFSIQIHQITGLELEKLSKTQTDKGGEADDEEEEGDELPSAYCTVIINHSKVFKTRTKPKNAKPFYNAGTEKYIADWRNTEVYVSVRDSRLSEDNPLLGIVHLPLGEVFKDRSQINGFYPLMGGIGFGRIRISMVWRSIELQAPLEAIGWQYGTVDVQRPILSNSVPDELRGLKLKFHTDLGSGKMYHSKDHESYNSKHDQNLKLPVRRRYSSCLAIAFQSHGMLKEKTVAFAVLWLKDIPDHEEREVTIGVWKGDYERATKNALPEPGEKVGSITLKVTFWEGLGAAHSKFVSNDKNLQEVAEVLDTARDNDELEESEHQAGIVDGDATDSSDEDSENEQQSQANGSNDKKESITQRAKGLKKHHEDLNKRNRGLMQWRIPRTAQWAVHKAEHTESKFKDLFKHHTRQPGIETEV